MKWDQTEYLAVDDEIEQRMCVAEIRMLKWMSGETIENMIRNEYVIPKKIKCYNINSSLNNNYIFCKSL